MELGTDPRQFSTATTFHPSDLALSAERDACPRMPVLLNTATRTLLSNDADGLRRGGAVLVDSALRFGQKLAAWNVGFEGARGGMYAIERATLERVLHELAAGGNDWSDIGSARGRRKVARVACPACPPQRRRAPSVAAAR